MAAMWITNTSVHGFAPAKNPRVIVAVTIDEPTANGYYGGVVAGPSIQRNHEAGLLNIFSNQPLNNAATVKEIPS